MDFETFVAAKGFDPATLSETQKTFLQAMWRQEQGAETPAQPRSEAAKPAVENDGAVEKDVAAVFAPRRKERERAERITELGAKYGDSNPDNLEACEAITAKAIKEKWSLQETELELMRAARPNAPVTHYRDEPEVGAKVIEAAVCRAAGLTSLEKDFDSRTLEAAHKNFRNGLGLADLIQMTARRNGYRGGGGLKSNYDSTIKAAFLRSDDGTPRLTAGLAGPSTYTLPNILSNVANKFLTQGFMAVDQAWREIARIGTANDFKQITTIAPAGGDMFAVVPRGGELKHGDLNELAYTNQIDTYGRMLGIDRRDIINDDIGAFSGLNARIGRGGALKLNDKFWTVFLNNTGSFFTAGHTNVSTGVLGLAGLTAADLAFRIQVDPDGFPIATEPKILLVPPALVVTAKNLMNSTITVSTTTANTPIPAGNPFSGQYQVVTSPYMQNSSYTGYSAVAYYLLASPGDQAVIEVRFLNGQQTPIVEQSDLDWNTLGIAIRGYFDFGVALQEYRGGVRSTGA